MLTLVVVLWVYSYDYVTHFACSLDTTEVPQYGAVQHPQHQHQPIGGRQLHVDISVC